MADFKYRGFVKNGKTIRGKVTGKDKHEIFKKLKDSNIQPIAIKSLKAKKIKIKEPKSAIDFKKISKIAEMSRIGKKKIDFKILQENKISLNGLFKINHRY